MFPAGAIVLTLLVVPPGGAGALPLHSTAHQLLNPSHLSTSHLSSSVMQNSVQAGTGSSAYSVDPSPNEGSDPNFLNAVSCTSSSSCVTVGEYYSAGVAQTLTETWNGTGWSIVPSPNQGAGNNELVGVSCTSSSFCVAVGIYSSLTGPIPPDSWLTLIETWNGSTWSITPSPNQGSGGNWLSGVSCTSSTNCVAVGYYYPAPQALIETWNGVAWTITPADQAPSGFLGVSCASSSFCVAVGNSATGTLVETWNGRTRSITPSPNPNVSGTAQLFSVSCTSSSFCEAVGWNGSITPSPLLTLAETWDGTAWSITPSPNQSTTENLLYGVSCASQDVCAAVGFSDPSSGPSSQTLIESWDGTAWSLTSGPNPSTLSSSLHGVSAVGSDPVGVGSYDNASGVYQTLVEGTSQPQYKISLYEYDYPDNAPNLKSPYLFHSFVQLTGPGERETVGLYPVLGWEVGFSIPPIGYIATDSGSAWNYRITWTVSQKQFLKAKQYVSSLQNSNILSPPIPVNGKTVILHLVPYNNLLFNCTTFSIAVARTAGINVPDFSAGGIVPSNSKFLNTAGKVLNIQDAIGENALLSKNVGNTINGGLVSANPGFPGATAGGAPDPQSLDFDPLALAENALSSPSATASYYSYSYDSNTVSSVTIGVGGTAKFDQTATNSEPTMTAIDWGDGSNPDFIAQKTTKASAHFDHVYASPGTYLDRFVVIEGGAIHEFDGTVVVGQGKTKALQTASVPPPPQTQILYTPNVPAAPAMFSATVTSISSSATTVVAKQPVSLTATVDAAIPDFGTPTGTVEFLDGSKKLGTAALVDTPSGAQATLTVTKLAVGEHSITAIYKQAVDFLASSSIPITQAVQP